ncbi:MAG: PQQ-dependent sugar dehydrogenase [Caulobacteraceae bacterium]|nr:PQQ-dependent sugar dehydrogenase [Caulobacteraceae bacterium]
MARFPALPLILLASAAAGGAAAQEQVGAAAYGDWRADAPGVVRKINPADMPAPYASKPAAAPSSLAPRPAGAELKTLPGFTVQPFAKLQGPRTVRVAPNGDIFVAETEAGQVSVLRAADGAAKPTVNQVFVDGIDRPFGVEFYPPGPNPQWVYVASPYSVVRFPYANGDLKARGPSQTIVAKLAADTHGHSTRDLAFSPDGRRLYISVGSASNVAEAMPKKSPDETKAWQADHALGAAWGNEEHRADVLVADPDGKNLKVFAAGIRNCAGLAVNPATRDVWCATNERDLLGDNLPPDYATRVREGGFYGWPWYYIGDHEDPRLKGQRPDLAGKAITPDVLFQPHSAPLGISFYTARGGPAAFPAEYRGDAFVGLHGSWNRALRTGYKVVRLKLRNGVPTGEYEDFVTGFVIDGKSVWGRPVDTAVAHDGALLFTDDAGDTLWRVAYAGH